MSARSPFRRRDPFWEVDGRAARREQRMRRFRAGLAFAASLAALAGATYAWSIQLGIASALGIRASLPF
jgi:hypothetical protein